MAHRREFRVNRRADELLLEGHGGDDPLAAVLAAASAPPHAAELLGQGAVVAEFRRVAATRTRPSRWRSLAPRLVAAKAFVALVVGGVAVGGVALAATTGSLPSPLQSEMHRLFGAPLTASPSHPGASPRAVDPSARTASMIGLCRAYQVAAATDPRHAADESRFAELIRSAGGRNAVAGYCVRLINSTPAPSAVPGVPATSAPHPGRSPQPSPAPHPSPTPGGHATPPHPTGPPTSPPSHPGGPASATPSHPSGHRDVASVSSFGVPGAPAHSGRR